MVQIGDLQDKAVLVTGASSGIGAAVSRAFARQGAAWRCIGTRMKLPATAVAQQIRAAGGAAELFRAIWHARECHSAWSRRARAGWADWMS